MIQRIFSLLHIARLQSAQVLPSKMNIFPLSLNISPQFTLTSNYGFTSYEQTFPRQKCNYGCRIQNVLASIFFDQAEEEFGQSLQLLANYHFNFYLFNLITQKIFLTFTQDINS